MNRLQPYSQGINYTYLAEKAGIDFAKLFWDPSVIVEIYRRANAGMIPENIRDVSMQQLKGPQLAPIGYGHISALGCPISRPEGGEPHPESIIGSTEYDFVLKEPENYMEVGIMPERRRIAEEVSRLWGNGWKADIALNAEGPITTAVLMVGSDFLMWPYDNPEAAHRLLAFITRTAVDFILAIGNCERVDTWFMTDDFSGLLPPEMFDEFVVPYWNEYYRLLGCTKRYMHAELLRPGHLKYLTDAGVVRFDPGVDQYLTPELLQEYSPVPFQLRINDMMIRDYSISELLSLYKYYSSFNPVTIQFNLDHPGEEEKYLALLKLAKEMNGE